MNIQVALLMQRALDHLFGEIKSHRYRKIVLLRKYTRVREYSFRGRNSRVRISPYGENCRRFRVASFMGICSHIYIPLVKGEDWYCTRRVDQSKCTDGRNARGGKSNIIVEREW